MYRMMTLPLALAGSLSATALADEPSEIEQVLENYSGALSAEDVVEAER